MTIKKDIVDYEKKVYEIISIIKSQLDNVRLLTDEDFISIQNAYNLTIEQNWKELKKTNPKLAWSTPKPLPINDLQYFKTPFKIKEDVLNNAMEWLIKFLDDNLSISKIEPIEIHWREHPWGIYLGNYFGGSRWGGSLKREFSYGWWAYSYSVTPMNYEGEYLRECWLYQDALYSVEGNYSDDERKLLVLEYAVKERRKFEKLKKKFSEKETEEIKYERTRIPEEVRIAVWRRDQGKCARCGNRENLEYDHIVPVSKGGGNTVRNIELLCQDCNRSKGNRIE